MSTSTEPAAFFRPSSIVVAVGTHRRGYRCYNCSHLFHVTTAYAADPISPPLFRCPRCYQRHLLPLPQRTIAPSPSIAPPPPPPPPPSTLPTNSIHSSGSIASPYYTSDDSDSDDDYDSDSSLLSFTSPNFHSPTPALRSFVDSLPMKTFLPNSNPSVQSCSICLEVFEINTNADALVNELPCEHYFHKDCIAEWLKCNCTCPLCRFKLPIQPHQEERPTQWVEVDEPVFPLGLPLRGVQTMGRATGIHRFGATSVANSNRLVLSDRRINGLGFDVM